MERILNQDLREKVCSAEEAAKLFTDGMTVVTSGFTPSGYPKAVPLALAKRIKQGENLKFCLITGASVGKELDSSLAEVGAIARRVPYQTNKTLRSKINLGEVPYKDIHLSKLEQELQAGVYGEVDIAIVEAIQVREDGGIVPSTSVGITPTGIQLAKQVIVEINTAQSLELIGVHDIYVSAPFPNRQPIPIVKTGDRIGTEFIPCDPAKIVAIVYHDMPDDLRDMPPVDDVSAQIGSHIVEFLKAEVAKGALPENLLPIQSGVGGIANAVLSGLESSGFQHLTCYSEVIQDSMLDLIKAGVVDIASGTSFSPSPAGYKKLMADLDFYKQHCVLRPMSISNHPEVIRRLGVIAINTAIEVDIYGHVNSTNIMGSLLMNGIGGSGDFARNGAISIFTTPATAKRGDISSIVPFVSHVDHCEHDVDVIVTEFGYADLRGLSPRERAKRLIEVCAHPDYKQALYYYFEDACRITSGHEPHVLSRAFDWHSRYLRVKSMKGDSD